MEYEVTDTSPRVFAPVGMCIYCGKRGTLEALSREHIIPQGIKDGLILPEASCEECRRITENFETICQRKMLLPYRLSTGMVRHPKQIRGHIPLLLDAGNQGPKTILVTDHPNVIVLPAIRQRAGLFVGRPPRDALDAEYRIFAPETFRLNFKERMALQKQARVQFDLTAYARMLAKIALGVAVAEIGLDALDSDLPDLILGMNDALAAYLIGSEEVPHRLPPRVPVHQVGWSPFSWGQRWMVGVHIKMFAELNDPHVPGYTVVAGEITSNEILARYGLPRLTPNP